MVALYTCWDNFVRQHKTLWSMEDVVALIDAQAEPMKKRRTYKPRAANAA